MTTTSFDDLQEGAALRAADRLAQANATGRNATNATAPSFAAPMSAVVSLALRTNNSEVPVQGLLKPIFFSIPLDVDLLAATRAQLREAGNATNGTTAGVHPDKVVAQCGWWDASAGEGGEGAYSQEGCYSLPNPRPPGAAVSWVRGFQLNARDYNITYWHRS